jgi:exopolysaccharide biosynthesis polyprenyl glycosylphosphotransferase
MAQSQQQTGRPLRTAPGALRLHTELGAPDRTAAQEAISDHLPKLPAVRERDARYRRSLAVADLVAAATALLLATVPFGHSLSVACLLVVPLVVGLAKVEGLYDRDELLIRKRTLEEAPQLLRVAALTAFALWLLNTDPAAKSQLVIVVVALLGGALLARRTARSFAVRLVPVERCLFVGEATEYERLRSKLRGPATHAELVGRMSLRPADPMGDAETGELTALRDLIAETGAHRVIIEPQVLPPEDMLDFVRAAKALGMHVSLLPRVLDVVGTAIVLDDLDGMTVLGVRRFGLTRSSLLVKRAFDVTVATLVLLVAAPVMAAIALAIKLDSGGPVLFWQVRVGRDGRRFRMCKFRTMVADAEERKEELRKLHPSAGLFKLEGDPRATRVGRRLRASSLDELPQLLNVLRGEMSLVGPRPLVLDEDAQIKGWDRRRLYLTPGMTGNWQIASSGRVPLPEMVKIDYLYVAGWSLWLDLKILLRTVPHVLARRGL